MATANEAARAAVVRSVRQIKTWDRLDQLWWRHLLDEEPHEALLVARLALMGAKPIDVQEETHDRATS